MPSRYTIMIFSSENSKGPRSLELSPKLYKILIGVGYVVLGAVVFLLVDYIQLRRARPAYMQSVVEADHLRSEAKIVAHELELAKKQLQKVDGYMLNLKEMVSLEVDRISEKTGVGPLSEEESLIQQQNQALKVGTIEDAHPSSPLGISYKDFVFRPLIQDIRLVDRLAYRQNNALQKLLLNLQKKHHLFSSIPLGKPVRGWLASVYGMRISPFTGNRAMHYGIDIAAPVGTPIYAPADGVVIFSGRKSGFGRFLMIAHDHGIVTKYGHNSELLVRTGDTVERGDVIAAVGRTGRTTGPHLHYEVWVNGRPKNPGKFLLQTDLSWNL